MTKEHFGDKVKHCDFCHEDVFIPFNQVGGVWYLNGWKDADGKKVFGTACSKCFGQMDDGRKLREKGGI